MGNQRREKYVALLLSISSEDVFTHTYGISVHDYCPIMFRSNVLYVHCIANKTDKYDPEAFMIYNEYYASYITVTVVS